MGINLEMHIDGIVSIVKLRTVNTVHHLVIVLSVFLDSLRTLKEVNVSAVILLTVENVHPMIFVNIV